MRPGIVALPLLVLATSMQAQARPDAAPRITKGDAPLSACARTAAEAERQVREIEEAWVQAFQRGDAAAFDRILADDFTFIGDAETGGKAAFMDGVRGAARPIPDVTISEDRFRVLGDVVIATADAAYGSPPVRQRITEVFVCRDGRWQAVHGHYATVPPLSPTAPVPADSLLAAAVTELRAGRGAAARAILERGAQAGGASTRRLVHQVTLGAAHLLEGDTEGARATYAAAAATASSMRMDDLASRAHYGLALVDAIAGRPDPAEAHLAESLRLGEWSGDSLAMQAMLYAALGQAARVHAAVDRMDVRARASGDAGPMQFVHAFRGVALAEEGRCADALGEIARAPQQDRPIPNAVRARCAAAGGQRSEAVAARDAVFQQVPEYPFEWYYIVARHLARQVR